MSNVGLFPQDGQRLRQDVERLLADSPDRDLDPELLIVPHGSFNQVGEVLAQGYGAIDHDAYRNVVILAGKHRDIGPDVAFTEQSMSTPIGRVTVDEMFTKQLLLDDHFSMHDKLHDLEDAIDPQLPFLQVANQRFTIAPIIVGNGIDDATTEAVSSALAGILHPNDLVVVVTNLHQGTSDDDIQGRDSRLINRLAEQDLSFLEEEGGQLCGWRALEIGVAMTDTATTFHRLAYTTVAGDDGSYGAGSFCFAGS